MIVFDRAATWSSIFAVGADGEVRKCLIEKEKLGRTTIMQVFFRV